jgi:Protein of unknown function DUF262
MAGGYEKAITIQTAINNIVQRRYLLPAIQRKFEWDIDRICVLFDSIMRGYPINTFMFWEIQDPAIKTQFKFYQFLEKYCERFAEDNPDFDTRGHGTFDAVIDGQQRLTSIYIGLKGTYANKLPRKHFPRVQDDSILPPRRLYLNLAKALEEEANEDMMQYDFQFLTSDEFAAISATQPMFLVGDVLELKSVEEISDLPDVIQTYLDRIGQGLNTFARQAITKLYMKLRYETLIHYYKETNQAIDHVLNIFVRTNKGGKPLSFSTLLMSIAAAHWKSDAREQIDSLVQSVWQSPDMGFAIDRDWILKTALVLTDANVKFKVENFSSETMVNIEVRWEEIKACILATFRLIHLMGLTEDSLAAKNAAIPIAYYLFHKDRDPITNTGGRYQEINNLAKHHEDRKPIAQWLMMSLLKRVFSGQGDTLLANLRGIIRDNLNGPFFPLGAIISSFKGTNKDLAFDEDFIDRLLKTEKDHPSCYSILALVMPERVCTTALHKDHLHPAAAFSPERLDEQDFLHGNLALRVFYESPQNWNTIANLHLLDGALNQSKQDQPLLEWFTEQPLSLDMLMIPPQASLEFTDFPDFMKARAEFLTMKLKALGNV